MKSKFGAAFIALAIAVVSVMRPAAADQGAQTRNIILGAVAAIGIATYANVQHKRAVANSVVGYTPDGATVYQDGHVVTPDGQSYYPNKYGQSVACSGQSCSISGNGNNQYNPYGGYGYNNANTPYANTVQSGYNGYGYGGYPRDQRRQANNGR